MTGREKELVRIVAFAVLLKAVMLVCIIKALVQLSCFKL